MIERLPALLFPSTINLSMIKSDDPRCNADISYDRQYIEDKNITALTKVIFHRISFYGKLALSKN